MSPSVPQELKCSTRAERLHAGGLHMRRRLFQAGEGFHANLACTSLGMRVYNTNCLFAFGRSRGVPRQPRCSR